MRPLDDELESLCLRHNTPQARIQAANIPPGGWTFATFPGDPHARVSVQGWTAEAGGGWTAETGGILGLVLQGPTGVGKTGLAVSAAAHFAERGTGSGALWNLVTSPGYLAEAAAGTLQRRPAPVWFEPWVDLRDRLRASWRRSGEGAEDALLADLRERVAVLAVDDLDVDPTSDWKESVLLRLLRLPDVGRRLIVTVNTPVTAFPQRFGERSADRLLDPSRFLILRMTGRSLRRRLGAP